MKLSKANAALRSGDYEVAISFYKELLTNIREPLIRSVRFNLAYTEYRLGIKNNNSRNTSISNIKLILKLAEEVDSIRAYFDKEFYLNNLPGNKVFYMDPVEHYCTVGWRQCLDPHPDFSTRFYLTANPDVRQADINPFLHWIVYGRLEGRSVKSNKALFKCNPVANSPLFKVTNFLPKIQDPVDIIVPIFNAFDDLVECLNRLCLHTKSIHRVILIDDASTDARIQVVCDEFRARKPNTLILSNISNQGFIKTVNRGFSEASGHVVLLNTDAFVPEGWLERLMPALLLDSSVATVTPMTNNGEIANVPVACNAITLLHGVADRVDRIAGSFDPLDSLVKVPTGVGFCMAMSRFWLDKVPSFDTVFGRGYGEEVDWCQRVRQLGGKHLVTGALFVEHRGGMSFGVEKQARVIANNKIVSQRYPDYDSRVQRFVTDDPAIAVRLALGIALLSTEGLVSVYLAHRLGGGAEIWLEGVVGHRLAKNQSSVVVRDGDIIGTALIELHTVAGVTKGNVSLDELGNYIGLLSRKELVYSCLVASHDPLKIIDVLVKILSKTDKLRVLFHDYFPLCPSYTLIGKNYNYCGLPSSVECETCFQSIKKKTLNAVNTIESWRTPWKALLDRANEIDVFSLSSKKLVCSVWPDLHTKIMVMPHIMTNLPRKIKNTDHSQIVVGVLGSIGYQKGAKVLHDLATEARELLKIVVIGELDPKYSHPQIRVHGRYQRNEISKLAEEHSISCWFMPSVWPETFSYVTRECIATGLPVYAFDVGAQAEAVGNCHNGILIPLEASTKKILNLLVGSL